MKAPRNEAELSRRLAIFLKSRIEQGGVSYNELAARLAKLGFPDETKDSLRAKIKRGRFPGTFFIAAVAALGISRIDLKDV